MLGILGLGLKIKRISSETLNVENTSFTDTVKRYLENEVSRKSSRILHVEEITEGRRNFTVEDFYGATATITLTEYSNPKQTQFHFPDKSASLDTFETDVRSGEFLKAIEKNIDQYSNIGIKK